MVQVNTQKMQMPMLMTWVMLLVSCGSIPMPTAVASVQKVVYPLTPGVEPYKFDDNGTIGMGLIDQIVRLLFEGPAYELVPQRIPISRLYLLVQSGGIPPVILYGHPEWFNPELRKKLSFSALTLLEQKHVAITLKSSKLEMNRKAELRNRKAILIRDFRYTFFSEVLGVSDWDGFRAKNLKMALRALQLGRGDYILSDELRAYWELKDKNGLFKIQDLSELAAPTKIYLALDKRFGKGVITEINQKLTQLSISGELSRILKQFRDY